MDLLQYQDSDDDQPYEPPAVEKVVAAPTSQTVNNNNNEINNNNQLNQTFQKRKDDPFLEPQGQSFGPTFGPSTTFEEAAYPELEYQDDEETEKRKEDIHIQLERFLPPRSDPTNTSRELADRFSKFWELRERGKTINENLRSARNFDNPKLVENLMPIFQIEEFSSLLPKEIYDPSGLPAEDFLTEINKQRQEKENIKSEQEKTRTSIAFTKVSEEHPPLNHNASSQVSSIQLQPKAETTTATQNQSSSKDKKNPSKVSSNPYLSHMSQPPTNTSQSKTSSNPYMSHPSKNSSNPYLSQSSSNQRAFGGKPKRRF